MTSLLSKSRLLSLFIQATFSSSVSYLFLSRLTFFICDFFFKSRIKKLRTKKKEAANNKRGEVTNKNRSRCPVHADHSRYWVRDQYCSSNHIFSFQSSGIILLDNFLFLSSFTQTIIHAILLQLCVDYFFCILKLFMQCLL